MNNLKVQTDKNICYKFSSEMTVVDINRYRNLQQWKLLINQIFISYSFCKTGMIDLNVQTDFKKSVIGLTFWGLLLKNEWISEQIDDFISITKMVNLFSIY